MRYLDHLRHITAARLQAGVNVNPETSEPLSPEDIESAKFLRQLETALNLATFLDDRVPELQDRIARLEKALKIKRGQRSFLPWRRNTVEGT